jgi:hypothetical protein
MLAVYLLEESTADKDDQYDQEDTLPFLLIVEESNPFQIEREYQSQYKQRAACDQENRRKYIYRDEVR